MKIKIILFHILILLKNTSQNRFESKIKIYIFIKA